MAWKFKIKNITVKGSNVAVSGYMTGDTGQPVKGFAEEEFEIVPSKRKVSMLTGLPVMPIESVAVTNFDPTVHTDTGDHWWQDYNVQVAKGQIPSLHTFNFLLHGIKDLMDYLDVTKDEALEIMMKRTIKDMEDGSEETPWKNPTPLPASFDPTMIGQEINSDLKKSRIRA